jgi:2-(1,2-epoxy-1,2-dihydrophenyl)acetyl-CoA isomerase
MDYKTIRLEIDGAFALLTLDRPDKLNAVTMAMHRELKDAVGRVRDCGSRALLITGAGRGFCAGQDLTDPEASFDEGADIGRGLEDHYNPLILSLRDLAVPIVCAVNGVAAGAGMSLALACDIVLAARSAQFIQAFSRIGLIPDAGSTWFLTRALGEPRAKALAMLGEPLTAEMAERWGLVWRVVDDDRLMDEGRALAERLAGQATHALGLTKQAIQAAGHHHLRVQLDLERELQAEAGRTADFREGVAAFVDKRPARFTGS